MTVEIRDDNTKLFPIYLNVRARETRRGDKKKKTGYRSYVVVQAGINEAHALTNMQNVVCLIFTQACPQQIFFYKCNSIISASYRRELLVLVLMIIA